VSQLEATSDGSQTAASGRVGIAAVETPGAGDAWQQVAHACDGLDVGDLAASADGEHDCRAATAIVRSGTPHVSMSDGRPAMQALDDPVVDGDGRVIAEAGQRELMVLEAAERLTGFWFPNLTTATWVVMKSDLKLACLGLPLLTTTQVCPLSASNVSSLPYRPMVNLAAHIGGTATPFRPRRSTPRLPVRWRDAPERCRRGPARARRGGVGSSMPPRRSEVLPGSS
jgi:hypothetical protein